MHIFAGITLVSLSKFPILPGVKSKHAKLRRHNKAIFACVIVALLMSQAFVRLNEAGMLLRIFDPKALSDIGQPDYVSAANMVKSQMLPTDVIMSSRPHVTYYLFGHTEYWLVSAEMDIREMGREVNGKTVDYMVGAELISNFQEFSEVIQSHHSVWIFVPYYHLSPGIIDPETFAVMNTLFSHDVTPDGTVYIYHWNNSLQTV